MSDLELYLDLLSQPCRAVYIFAKLNEIPFSFHKVNLFKADKPTNLHLTGVFARINSLLNVPVLKDGNFKVTESNSMLLYMVRKYKTPDHWYPSDIQKCSRVDEYLAWQQTNTRYYGCKVFWVKVRIFQFTVLSTPEKVHHVLAEFDIILTQIEKLFLKDHLFLAGDEISLADLIAVHRYNYCYGFNVFEDRPKLGAWKERVEEAVGSDLFREAHESILNIKEQHLISLSSELKKLFKRRLLKLLK
uniref:glutathione transferase n=1 Tax=Leptobrachium leishanense TaxID=445787 RepID=A0A8C5LKV9_9ANUR